MHARLRSRMRHNNVAGQPMEADYTEFLMGNRKRDSKLLAQRPGRSRDRQL